MRTPFLYEFIIDRNGIPKVQRCTKFDKFICVSNNNGVRFNFRKPLYIHNREVNSYNVISFLDTNITFFNEEFDEKRMAEIFLKNLIDERSIDIDNLNETLVRLKFVFKNNF